MYNASGDRCEIFDVYQFIQLWVMVLAIAVNTARGQLEMKGQLLPGTKITKVYLPWTFRSLSVRRNSYFVRPFSLAIAVIFAMRDEVLK